MPRDVNERAKLLVDWSVGEVEPISDPPKDPAAVARGRLGGAIGGTARAAKLTPEERSAIAKKAAAKRWGK